MNVKDNRSFWVYLLLSIVTCGLYSIYFWYVYVEDLNTIFYGDGEDSPNYIIVLLLSWVTCGIYGVYWRYKQANRMYRESYDRYGVMIEENGSAILLWTLLGYLTGGIGQLLRSKSQETASCLFPCFLLRLSDGLASVSGGCRKLRNQLIKLTHTRYLLYLYPHRQSRISVRPLSHP